MKREFIKGLNVEGLTDEIIEKIMAENGKDIEAAKTKADKSQEIENLKNELKTTKETLEQANVQIKSFEGLDVEGIKKQADEWKTKYETFETQSKTEKEAFEKKLQDQQYDFAVKEYLGNHKFQSEFAKEAFYNNIKSKGFKLEEGKLLGADDYVKEFQAKNQGVFVIEEAPKDPNAPSYDYDFTAPTGTQTQDKKIPLTEAMRIANEGGKVDLTRVQ